MEIRSAKCGVRNIEVGTSRCDVPLAERSVRRGNESAKVRASSSVFRPLERGRGHRSAMSLPEKPRCLRRNKGPHDLTTQ
jgi:hypothetical protein